MEEYTAFLDSVAKENQKAIIEINELLVSNHCHSEVKEAKSGYVVSYLRNDTKKIIANFVCRKSGVKIRMYLDHISEFEEELTRLPEKMKKEIQKASVCKRLIDPSTCNQKCSMGYRFMLGEEELKRCRFMAFMPNVQQETLPYILQLLTREIESQG